MTNDNTKRIARNTLLLYFRMLITMAVSLYTVRIVFETLGVIDYGIYNVVGGIVIMLGFLSNTMTAASQRYFTFELGRNDLVKLKKTFSITMLIYIMVALFILIVAETVGLWFLNTQMTIPIERFEAAHWVYQFSVLSFMMTLFNIPYHASIIAHENMKVYAWVSIIEVGLKLAIVYLLLLFSFDKLKLYAILMFGATSIVTLIYRTFCIKKFIECRFSFYWEKSLFKEIISYSGWNLFGALAGAFNNQGVNIVLNIFFGPTVNAARGIAFQVNVAINQFVQNFMIAARPQIIKYYAKNEKDRMFNLIFKSSKFSFLLLFILSMPLLLETNFIIGIWLKEIPEYAILFIRLIIIVSLIDSLSYPLMTAAQATGKIKIYQLVVGGSMILNLPIAYLFLKQGYPPQTVFYISIINSGICLFLRLKLLKKMVDLVITNYFSKVILPMLTITILAYVIPFILVLENDKGILRFILVTFTGLILTGFLILTFGLSKSERKYIIQIMNKYKQIFMVTK